MGADLVDRMNLLAARLNYNGFPESATDADEAATQLAKDAAEIVRLRGEVAALLEDPDEAELAYRCGDPDSDAIAPAEAKDPAPAMPNGVEGLVAEWEALIAHPDTSTIMRTTLENVVTRLRAADNRDAAGVAAPHWCKNCLGVAQESCPFNTTRDEPTPAAVPAGETNGDAPADVLEHLIFSVDRVANSGDYGLCDQAVVQLNYAIEDARRGIGTGTPQPADGEASMFAGQSDAQIAHAVRMAEQHYRSLGRDPVYCNVSLSVLRDCTPPAPVQAAPQEGEGYYLASFKHKANNGEVMWWKGDNAGYSPDLEQAGIYTELVPGYHDSEDTVPVPVAFLAGLRVRRTVDPSDSLNHMFWSAKTLRAALQHRGDSRGGEGVEGG